MKHIDYTYRSVISQGGKRTVKEVDRSVRKQDRGVREDYQVKPLPSASGHDCECKHSSI